MIEKRDVGCNSKKNIDNYSTGNKNMFKHSIKVPRIYKAAAKIAKDVSEGKGSLKELVYQRIHPNIKALYALVLHTLQHSQDIENLFKKSKLLIKEPRFDPWLAKILTTELLWGKQRLAGNSKPEQTIRAYEQIFKAHISDSNFSELQDNDKEQVGKPRYVRVNTLKLSVNEAVEGFRDEGWTFCRHPDKTDYNQFLEKISNLESNEFCLDFHIPNLLVFPPKTEFYKHAAYKNSQIILQDKASCLPIYFLKPEEGSVVLDMCAAPGMKTTQIAAMLNNKGTVYAVELDQKRYNTLNTIIESTEATCVKTINRDVLTLTEKEIPDVEYILVDPSCSGSGITNRLEFENESSTTTQERLQKLSGFQIKILRYALTKFPKAKRVVYSTCSLYPEENEDVVRQVLETNTNFKLVSAKQMIKGLWNNYGSNDFGEIGERCLYARPDDDLTHGFFVAVFERLQEGERNEFVNKEIFKLMKKERKRAKREMYENGEQDNFEYSKKKKNRRKEEYQNHEEEICVEENQNESNLEHTNQNSDDYQETKKKKRKRDKNFDDAMDGQNMNINDENDEQEQINKKKKKKHKKDVVDNVEEKAPTANDIENSELNGNDENNEEQINKKKKKKHKKDVDNVEQEAPIPDSIENFELNGIDKINKKKKKHKEKKEISEETIDTEIFHNNKKKKKDEEEIIDSEVHIKTKKKKKKFVEVEENNQ